MKSKEILNERKLIEYSRDGTVIVVKPLEEYSMQDTQLHCEIVESNLGRYVPGHKTDLLLAGAVPYGWRIREL